MKKIFILIGMILFLLTPLSLALGPNTHFSLTTRILDDSSFQSAAKEVCLKHIDQCRAGLVISDVSVIYYYTSFNTYKSLHDWNFLARMKDIATTEEEQACVVGYSIHLAQDTISHNQFIPNMIKSTGLPNEIIHPVAELAVDSRFTDLRTKDMLNEADICIKLVNSVSTRNWDNELRILQTAIGASRFYSEAFSPSSFAKESFINKIYLKFQDIVRPFVSAEAFKPFENAAIESTKQALQGTRPTADPSGDISLQNANRDVLLISYAFGFIFVGGLYFITKKLRLW